MEGKERGKKKEEEIVPRNLMVLNSPKENHLTLFASSRAYFAKNIVSLLILGHQHYYVMKGDHTISVTYTLGHSTAIEFLQES